MKIKIYYIFALILFSAVSFAGAYLDFFHARSENDNVRIEWKTGEENNVKLFVIERRTPQGGFVEVTSISPKGNYSYYSYLDETAYKAQDVLFIYKLKIVDTNNQNTYSSEISVSHNISGVKRTWGSIKAMFR
ncbi:MAG: hypothetical protein Q8903_10380 [Bacteroidota bacterium]|nr:hypothetical protein [Bacteroidota bacterium]